MLRGHSIDRYLGEEMQFDLLYPNLTKSSYLN